MVLMRVYNNPSQYLGYDYRVGSVDCATYSQYPTDWHARRYQQFPSYPGSNDDRSNTAWVVGVVYTCWARQGLVQADPTDRGPVFPNTSETHAANYIRGYLLLCGESVRPLGLPDSRPSPCTRPPNLNLP